MTRENELLRKIEKGDASCWEELAAMYYDDILRYCLYHTRDRETAEDAVQETFLKVIRYFPRYKNKGSSGHSYIRWLPIPVWTRGGRAGKCI